MTTANSGEQTTVWYLVSKCDEGVSTALCVAHEWQTLIAAAIALLAAWWTVRTIRLQIKEEQQRHSKSQRSKGWAARSRMPDSLSALCSYSEGCMKYLMDPANVDGPPIPPEEAINDIKAGVEYVDPNSAEKLFDLVTHYQIHNSRLSRDVGDDPFEITDRMYDTVYLRGLADRLFRFARKQEDTIPDGELTRENMLSALRGCVGLEVFFDQEDCFTQVIELIEIGHPEA